MRETCSQLQQMSIRQRQDMSGKLSNWSSLRRRVCHKELATLFLRSEAKCVTFPNIKILLTTPMVLPVSTATVECSFSDMKQDKDRADDQAIIGPPFHEVDIDAVLACGRQ